MYAAATYILEVGDILCKIFLCPDIFTNVFVAVLHSTFREAHLSRGSGWAY